MTSLFSWLNGISVLMLICAAMFFAIYYTFKYFKTKVKMYPYVAGIGYCEAIGFSGILISFISALTTGNANQVTLITNSLSYSTVGIGFWLCMYISWEIFFKPQYKKPALILLAIFGVGHYIIVYGFMDIMITTPVVEYGEILDDTLTYFSLAWYSMGTIGLIVFFLLALSFYRAGKSQAGIVRKKAIYLFLGFTLLSFGVMLDTMLIFDYIFIVRFWLAFSFYLWHKGL